MNVTTARDWIAWAARQASDTGQYSLADRDRAIQFIITDFARRVRLGITKSTISTTANNPEIDCASVSGFRAERLLRAWIGDMPALKIVDYQTILDSRHTEDRTGYPEAVGFNGITTAELWPTPDAAYTLNLLWLKPPALWTPGDAGAGATVLEIPDDYLIPVLSYGGAAILQHNEPEHAFATESWQKYMEYVATFAGGGPAATVFYRQKDQ